MAKSKKSSVAAKAVDRIIHKMVLTKSKGIVIEYTDGPQNHTVTSMEPPRPEIHEKLQELAQYVAGMLEVPREWVENNFNVRGISIKFNSKAGGEKAMIHFTKYLQGSPPHSGVTPLKSIHNAEDAMTDGPVKKNGKVVSVHPQMVAEIIGNVMELADGFLNGDRGPVEATPLFPDGDGDQQVEEEETEEVEQD